MLQPKIMFYCFDDVTSGSLGGSNDTRRPAIVQGRLKSTLHWCFFQDRNTCRQAQIYNHICLPGCVPQSVVPEVPDSIHGSATYFRCPSADSRRVSFWRNYVHLVLFNRLEGRDLSLPRNSVGSLPCTFAPPI